MISVIIPTYNEKKNIEKIIIKLKVIKIVSEIIFVDDHSNDGTYDEILKYKKYKAIGYLRKSKKNQICNCGYGKGYSIKEVAEIFKKKNFKNFSYSFTNKRLGDISYMVADVKKINKLLNWKPKFSSLEKMLTSEIKWKIKIKK